MPAMINFSDREIHKITKDFDEKRTIGKPGAFGQVYRGRLKGPEYKDCPLKVAVKISKIKNEYVCRMWQQEISALSTISHKNVITLLGYAEADDYYALVYERAERDLQGYQSSSKEELNDILLGVAKGVEAVHSAGYIHWDIQLRNLLLMKDGTVKVADFGLATKRDEKMVYFNDRRFGIFNANDTEDAKEKFDVFCFGRLARDLFFLEKGEWSPTRYSTLRLAEDCENNDPDKRPSMGEVVSRIKDIIQEEMEMEMESNPNKKARRSKK